MILIFLIIQEDDEEQDLEIELVEDEAPFLKVVECTYVHS